MICLFCCWIILHSISYDGVDWGREGRTSNIQIKIMVFEKWEYESNKELYIWSFMTKKLWNVRIFIHYKMDALRIVSILAFARMFCLKFDGNLKLFWLHCKGSQFSALFASYIYNSFVDQQIFASLRIIPCWMYSVHPISFSTEFLF